LVEKADLAEIANYSFWRGGKYRCQNPFIPTTGIIGTNSLPRRG